MTWSRSSSKVKVMGQSSRSQEENCRCCHNCWSGRDRSVL